MPANILQLIVAVGALTLAVLLPVWAESGFRQTYLKVLACKPEVVSSRTALDSPVPSPTPIQCVDHCITDARCHLAVHQVFLDGTVTCRKYSVDGLVFDTPWDNAKVQTCAMMQVLFPTCLNGGQWNGVICLCPSTFTGQYCQKENPLYCNNFATWGDKYTINGDVTSTISPVLALNDVSVKGWKIGYDDTSLDMYSVYHVDSSDVSQSPSFKAVAMDALERTSWDKLHTDGDRLFHTFSYANGNSELTTVDSNKRSITEVITTKKSAPFDLLLARKSRFRANLDFSSNARETDLTQFAGNGYEPLHFDYVNGISKVLESLRRRFFVPEGNSRPIWYAYKYDLWTKRESLKVKVMESFPIVDASSEALNVSTEPFNPCWWDLSENSDVSSEDFKSKVKSYLQHGHSLRLYVVTTAVLMPLRSALTLGDEMYFFLPEWIQGSSRGVYAFNLLAEGTRTIFQMPDTELRCGKYLESGVTTGSETHSGRTIKLFVDTRKWIKVYQVFSNSSVAFGKVSDLASGVLAGRDLNIWVKWLSEDREEFFHTSVNSVNRQGQVSSESQTLYDHKVAPPLTFVRFCGLKKILVSSEGRMEVNEYSATLLGSIKEHNDVMITWFLN